MAIFLTGATGYIGSYLAAGLLEGHGESLNVLVRAADAREAEQRLWQALQLHFDFATFREHLGARIRIFRGDLTASQFGLGVEEYAALAASTDSILHCAASLNRKSEKSCLNVNLRGTLEVVQLARRARETHGLRRFSQVSTVAVAGHRSNELVSEDSAIDWERSDYDPYARTKKFCEHMVRELLPDVSRTVFRPSIVLGDSQRPETTQFDMVRAFVFLASLPVLPFRPDDRIDIVPADYVAEAVVHLHQKERPEHEIYHLSSGTGSETFRQLTDALSSARGKMKPLFWPGLEGAFRSMTGRLARRRDNVGHAASLLKVFMPYLVWNTVFDNARVVSELGRAPAAFSSYCFPLLRFARDNRFRYPYRGWPEQPGDANAEMEPAAHATGSQRSTVGRVRAMMDLVLEAWVAALIERTKIAWILGAGRAWKPGEPLKLVFAGYNGTRNTGSDVRVEEMLRQVRRVLGAQNVALTVMTQNFERTRGYFGDAAQVHLPDIFPPFLYREVRRHHGVFTCEGSMFKSNFANALTTMMIGALGIAAAENKVSIGYGAEAGDMDPMLSRLCARYCKQSLILTRNEASQAVLSALGVPSELGTDTAWTFEPHGPEAGRRALIQSGWDGHAPVLAVCPIHPFWWPVKASVGKFVLNAAFGAYRSSHYRSVYFHTSGAAVDAAFERYISSVARAVEAFRQRHGVFVALVAMERLDARACEALAPRLGQAAILTSDQYDMYELVSVLRACDLMVSSRYHGIVTAMPGLVPSAGITMDERIRNLMHERGQEDLLMTVDEPDLEAKLLVAMEKLRTEADAVREAIGRTVVSNLKRMARMGMFLEQNVRERYPEFPAAGGVRSWEEYLPPLSPGLVKLVETYESHANAVGAD